jgi:3-deoxy-D-manno-octulosonic-acid transferase
MLVGGRKRAFETIGDRKEDDAKVFWFHCASLGEFEQGLPVMESIKSAYPGYLLYVSFFSPSGYEVQKDNMLADGVFYLPSDTKSNAEKLISVLHPEAVFFIKYEYWYHYMKACHRRKIPVFSISTILRPDQLFFKPYGGFYRKILYLFDYFFVQNRETFELLQNIGITNVIVSGDTRFDRVHAISKQQPEIDIIKRFKGSSELVVLGSTWKQDIDLWISFINSNRDLKYIIAPHNVDEAHIKYIEKKVTQSTLRFSILKEDPENESVLIIDNIGMLSAIYRYADITYVGGAFGEGLHNILEPATFGKPVIIGKARSNMKYQEVSSLVKAGGAFEVSDIGDLELKMNDLLKNRDYRNQAGEASRAFVEANLGSTDKIVKTIMRIMS